MSPLLEANDLVRVYAGRKGLFGKAVPVRAVDGVSLRVNRGETLGIVGESGSGKSTLGRLLLGVDPAQGGTVRFDGHQLPEAGTQAWRAMRARMQMVYQDPLAALDRRLTIATQIREPLDIHRVGTPEQREARVAELMRAVGLRPDQAGRYPHELSGGQRQRVAIARALALDPEVVICDEAVSALDVLVQAQILTLLNELQSDGRLSMVFISHDLKVVRNLCDRVAVMYLGRIVEEGPSEELFANPQHPYTQALISSVPEPGRALDSRVILQGEPPNPARRPSGCAFHPRCARATDICRGQVPELIPVAPGQTAACHHVTGARATRAA